MSYWFGIAGNFLFGGFIGWLIVDPATGGMWALSAKDGQDVENLNVILLENATDEIMSQVEKIN